MRVGRMLASLTRAAVGVLSFAMTGYGVYSFMVADLRRDTLLIALYCALPTMSFAVFLLSFRWLRTCAAIHCFIAAAYLTVFSMLNLRPCAELGYCDGVLNNLVRTLTAGPMEACAAIAILNLGALALGAGPHRATAQIASQKRA